MLLWNFPGVSIDSPQDRSELAAARVAKPKCRRSFSVYIDRENLVDEIVRPFALRNFHESSAFGPRNQDLRAAIGRWHFAQPEEIRSSVDPVVLAVDIRNVSDAVVEDVRHRQRVGCDRA